MKPERELRRAIMLVNSYEKSIAFLAITNQDTKELKKKRTVAKRNVTRLKKKIG